MYSSRILKSRYISVLEPVSIDTTLSESFDEYIEVSDTQPEEEAVNPEETAAQIIERAKEEAQAIIEQARIQAEELLQNRKEEAEAYKEEVLRNAYDEGYSKGYLEGKESLNDSFDALKKEAMNLQESYSGILDDCENQIVGIILDIARKVINEDVKLNKENMISLVKRALDICYEKQSALIKISEEDFEFINENNPQLISQINSNENISIKADINLKAGDCLVDTPFGVVDMGIDKCYEKIEDTFIKEVS